MIGQWWMDGRDVFALHAMQAYIGAYCGAENERMYGGATQPEEIARQAYVMADAMLAERKRRLDSEANAEKGKTAITEADPSSASSLQSELVRTESPTADGEVAANDGAAATSAEVTA